MKGLGLSSSLVLFTVFEGKTVNHLMQSTPVLADTLGWVVGGYSVRNSGKKIFCLLTDEIICSYANKVSDVTALN